MTTLRFTAPVKVGTAAYAPGHTGVFERGIAENLLSLGVAQRVDTKAADGPPVDRMLRIAQVTK